MKKKRESGFERDWSECKRISKKPSEKMSFWEQKAPKKSMYTTSEEYAWETVRVERMIEDKSKEVSTQGKFTEDSNECRWYQETKQNVHVELKVLVCNSRRGRSRSSREDLKTEEEKEKEKDSWILFRLETRIWCEDLFCRKFWSRSFWGDSWDKSQNWLYLKSISMQHKYRHTHYTHRSIHTYTYI